MNCIILDCSRPEFVRGLCSPHYQRARRAGSLPIMRPIERHGMRNTDTYSSWMSMNARCRRPSAPDYYRYGGRGITICERWRSFTNFLADMGERPTGLSLDRKDNEGNYEPGNCRWATPTEQAANKRPPALRTHCKRGHALTTENLYVNPSGVRRCRICHLAGSRRVLQGTYQ